MSCEIVGSNNVNGDLVKVFGNADWGPMECQTERRILKLSDRIQLSSEEQIHFWKII